jgi:hypothetical protein
LLPTYVKTVEQPGLPSQLPFSASVSGGAGRKVGIISSTLPITRNTNTTDVVVVGKDLVINGWRQHLLSDRYITAQNIAISGNTKPSGKIYYTYRYALHQHFNTNGLFFVKLKW